MIEKIYEIWFSNLKLSRKEKLNLLEIYSEKDLWNIKKEYTKENKFSKKVYDELLDVSNRKKAEKIYNFMIDKNIYLIKYNENLYPQNLKNIYDFPLYLYVRGNLNNLCLDGIGIVGSRNAGDYGKSISRKLAYEISKRNINVISGLAIGIDKQAHLGALDAENGNTIAILATSVLENEMYPLQNLKVFERILKQNGTIVSEYPFGSKLEKYKFVQRNRIISGIASKIIIIEAGVKSGSLITADFALEQGKDIFVVPGNINLENFEGSNNLIKQGAFLLNNVNDLFP